MIRTLGSRRHRPLPPGEAAVQGIGHLRVGEAAPVAGGGGSRPGRCALHGSTEVDDLDVEVGDLRNDLDPQARGAEGLLEIGGDLPGAVADRVSY